MRQDGPGARPPSRSLGSPPAGPRPEPPRTFTGQDLFNQIDGGAEIFLEFGFARLRLQAYARERAELTLNAYEMESAASALGVYLMKMGRETPFPEIAARNSAEESQMTIVKGRYFVQVDNLGDVAPRKPRPWPSPTPSWPASRRNPPRRRSACFPPRGRCPVPSVLFGGPTDFSPTSPSGKGTSCRSGAGSSARWPNIGCPIGPAFTRLIVPYPDAEASAAALAHLKANLDTYLKVTARSARRFRFRRFPVQEGLCRPVRRRPGYPVQKYGLEVCGAESEFLTPFCGREYHLFMKAGANIELKGSEFRAA